MDDATASDNYGEVTIECQARPLLAILQATTPSFTFLQRTMLKQLSATQTIQSRHDCS